MPVGKLHDDGGFGQGAGRSEMGGLPGAKAECPRARHACATDADELVPCALTAFHHPGGSGHPLRRAVFAPPTLVAISSGDRLWWSGMGTRHEPPDAPPPEGPGSVSRRAKLIVLGTWAFAEEVADLVSDCAEYELVAFAENWDRARCRQPLLGLPVMWVDDLHRLAPTASPPRLIRRSQGRCSPGACSLIRGCSVVGGY